MIAIVGITMGIRPVLTVIMAAPHSDVSKYSHTGLHKPHRDLQAKPQNLVYMHEFQEICCPGFSIFLEVKPI